VGETYVGRRFIFHMNVEIVEKEIAISGTSQVDARIVGERRGCTIFRE
jgi:hypothetical protein